MLPTNIQVKTARSIFESNSYKDNSFEHRLLASGHEMCKDYILDFTDPYIIDLSV